LNGNEDIPGGIGVVSFEWSENPEFNGAKQTPWMEATAERDCIVRASITDLKPGTEYFYRPIFGRTMILTEHGPVCRFKTLPGSESSATVRFVMGSCMNSNKFLFGKKAKASGPMSATEEDKRLGFPSFKAIADLKPDFFIGTGDIVYYDNELNGPAQTLTELRQCWHEQFRFERLKSVFNNTASYWSKDDHDFRFNDSDLLTSRLPLPQIGIELFREQMPIHPFDDSKAPTYRTHRLNRYVQLWFSEGRDYRSPNKMSDRPDKSLWGIEQREWLMKTIKESDAKWKILISPTPMVGPDDASKTDNHTNLGGFRHEAVSFFEWLKNNRIENFMTFCGDRHWQYHSRHPLGVEEFACGALNDENSRMGVPPGSKKGTDPEAKIEQLYTYQEPTGGFLYVTADKILHIEFRDDRGKLMYQVDKSP
jgi:alkaline phosphatase/alkaline phosphatase D